MMTRNKWFRAAALVLTVLIGLSLVAPVFAADDAGTIYLRDAQDLLDLAQACSLNTWSQGKTVVLQADISLSDVAFSPIPTFGGVFDGNGHTISGLNIDGSVTPAGLFSYLQATAVVKNLKVSGSVSPAGDGEISGGIVGENHGTVTGCSFTGTVSGEKNTGAIAGINASEGRIHNCESGGAIFGESMTGGIAGYNMGVIDGCRNGAYVNITSVDSSLKLDEISLDLMLNINNITSLDGTNAASDTGGIAGYSAGVIQNCVNKSTVGYQHVGYNVGGIAGRSCGYILNCENTADIYGRKDVGGIAGQIEPYIELNLSEDTLTKLQRQLDELNGMVDNVLNDANSGVGTVTNRLNKIADYVQSASGSAGVISTTGSISGTVSGSGQTSSGGSVTVTPPQAEVGGSGSAGSGVEVEIDPPSGSVEHGSSMEGEIHGGLTEGGIEGEHGSSGSGSVDASTQITMNTSLHGLTSAVSGMSGQMRLLNGEISGISSTLTEDLKAINDQINAICSTVFDAMLGTDQSGGMVDTSGMDIDSVTLGKTAASRNSGAVYGDISVGGIVGSMAVEYELDPEDDVSGNLSGTQRRSYEMKAIVQNCVNTGPVTAKRSYAGGICGKMNLGYLTGGENYGDVESEGGDYVGGIAGMTGSTIQRSYAKCTLRGGSYIGGIVGSGTAGDSEDASSTVAGCYSMVSIPRFTQYIGAVSGANLGRFTENYFISDDLAGINRLSYTGEAEPIAFAELLRQPVPEPEPDAEPTGEETLPTDPADTEEDGGETAEPEIRVHTVPDAFRQFTLRFVVEGKTVKTVPFEYGDSFDGSVYPEVPEKAGSYGAWDTAELKELHFDTTVTAVYTPYVTALQSTDKRANGHPIFFVEGQFDDQAELTAVTQPNTPSDFEVLPDGFWDTVRKCFTGKKLSREIVEQWALDFSDDGLNSHTVRFLAPDENPKHLDIYIKNGSEWEKTDAEAVGSYLTFRVEGTHAEIAVISTMSVWWIWLIAAAVVLLLLVLLIKLIRKLMGRKTRSSPPPAENTEEGTDQAEESKTPPAKKSRRWLMPLLIVLALLCGMGITAAYFLLPDLMTDLQVYELLKKYADQKEFVMELTVESEVGSQSPDFTALVDRQKLDGKTVTCVESGGMRLYYADDAVFLENGKSYRLGDACPDYSELLDRTVELYRLVDIQAGGKDQYTVTAEGNDARRLLEILAPAVVSDLADTQTVTVDLDTEDKQISRIRFQASGTLTDRERTAFTLSAELELEPSGIKHARIPEAVRDAIAEGPDEDAVVLTEELYTLAAAWDALDSTEALDASLKLSADCGPVVISDSLSCYRRTREGLSVGAVQKNGYTLYFTDRAVCDKDGRAASTAEDDMVESARLPEIVYELCMNGELSVTDGENGRVYSLTLDEEGMKAVACAIAPAAKDMDIFFEEGRMELTVEEERIRSVEITCTGSVRIMLSDVDVAFGAELVFSREAGDFTVPDKAYEALKEKEGN